jgi:outer membrane protein
MARALNDVADGKKAKEKLKAEFSSKQEKLDKMQKDLKGKKEAFDKQKTMMKPEVREQKEQELQKEFLELQQTYMTLQQELIGNESQMTQELSRKIRGVIAKIGDRDGYGMILDIGDGVLYYKRHQDITDEVVALYNQTHGASK